MNAANRRISIVVLNESTERAIGLREDLESKAQGLEASDDIGAAQIEDQG
jgi:hypothetical protein